MDKYTEDDLINSLKKYFNYDTFRPGQLSIIKKILENEDVIVCKESGFGKSLCYQLSGLLRKGVVVIVSALPSRIKEKCNDLTELKVINLLFSF